MAGMNWSTMSGGRGPLPRESGSGTWNGKRRKGKRKKQRGTRPSVEQLAASLKRVLDRNDRASAARRARLEAMRVQQPDGPKHEE